MHRIPLRWKVLGLWLLFGVAVFGVAEASVSEPEAQALWRIRDTVAEQSPQGLPDATWARGAARAVLDNVQTLRGRIESPLEYGYSAWLEVQSWLVGDFALPLRILSAWAVLIGAALLIRWLAAFAVDRVTLSLTGLAILLAALTIARLVSPAAWLWLLSAWAVSQHACTGIGYWLMLGAAALAAMALHPAGVLLLAWALIGRRQPLLLLLMLSLTAIVGGYFGILLPPESAIPLIVCLAAVTIPLSVYAAEQTMPRITSTQRAVILAANGVLLLAIWVMHTPDWTQGAQHLQARDPLEPALITFSPESPLGYYTYQDGTHAGIMVNVGWQPFAVDTTSDTVQAIVTPTTQGGVPVWVIAHTDTALTEALLASLDAAGYKPVMRDQVGDMGFYRLTLPAGG